MSKKKVSNEEINKLVSAALRKKSKEEPIENIDVPFQFNGKDYNLQFTRRYHRGRASLCIPSSCTVQGLYKDCCHFRKEKGIELCYTPSDNFELLKHEGEGIITYNIDADTEAKIFRMVGHVLDLISEKVLENHK